MDAFDKLLLILIDYRQDEDEAKGRATMMNKKFKIGLVLYLIGIGLDVGNIHYILNIGNERAIFAFVFRLIGILMILFD